MPAVYYHPGRTGTGGDFIYYVPLMRMKIDGQTARSGPAATRVFPEDMPIGWLHEENDTPRNPRKILMTM